MPLAQWAPKSPDLAPYDYLLWGCVRSLSVDSTTLKPLSMNVVGVCLAPLFWAPRCVGGRVETLDMFELIHIFITQRKDKNSINNSKRMSQC
ncbi:hypothetical protein TNCV_903781 [Trichonephila clavipes]|nr:hypothetical protein TNCV_903781 [Trichonephila clavipes]